MDGFMLKIANICGKIYINNDIFGENYGYL